MTTDVIYYECHVTVEPVFGDRLELFDVLCRKHGFRIADLLMQKSRQETPVRSNKDSFCTARGRRKELVFGRMEALAKDLIDNGFDV